MAAPGLSRAPRPADDRPGRLHLARHHETAEPCSLLNELITLQIKIAKQRPDRAETNSEQGLHSRT